MYTQKKYLDIKSNFYDRDNPDPELVYWISPERIVFHTNYTNGDNQKCFSDCVFHPVKDKGKIYSGDWDISNNRFIDLDIYKAIKGRIKENEPWENTEYYNNIIKKINAGETPWGCSDIHELDKRCEYIDTLINSIKKHGYQLNHTIKLDNDVTDISKTKKFSEEISVNIGRDGHYFFQDGRHRLAIARLLKVEKIPVKVLVRHKKWVEFMNFMALMAEGNSGASRKGLLYQNPVHPDLQDIPASHACEDRFQAIYEHLDNTSGRLLDIGTNLGYFSHRFTDIGFECYAVEYVPDIAQAAQKIRISESKAFNILEGSIFDSSVSKIISGYQYEVVLALSIFHHFIKTRDQHDRLTKWLNNLKTKIMIFEPHLSDESQMKGSYENYNESDFVAYILANTSLTNSKKIYTCDDGRSIYKLSHCE